MKQWAWPSRNDEASTTNASTSASSMAVTKGISMFPAVATLRPEYSNIWATSVTTVVLPLVPVTAHHGLWSQAAAKSDSSRMLTPARCAASNTGCRSGIPGLTTTSPQPSSKLGQSPSSGAPTRSIPCSTTQRLSDSPGWSSTVSTGRWRDTSAVATARPVTPMPTTMTGVFTVPAPRSCRLRRK